MPDRCVLGVLICFLRAAESGCIISDVGFYNFGVVEGRVVIIDAGSRGVSEERFSKKTLTQAFWKKNTVKAREQCVEADDKQYLEDYISIYSGARTIREALYELELFWQIWPTCDRTRTDVKDESAIGSVPEDMSVRVNEASSSSFSAFPAHRRAPKPQLDSEVNEPTASPSQLRAPKLPPAVEVKLEGREEEQSSLAIAWDCQLYTQAAFFEYYGRNLEFQQCEGLTDEIIGCMGLC